jgi:hypothetical protein
MVAQPLPLKRDAGPQSECRHALGRVAGRTFVLLDETPAVVVGDQLVEWTRVQAATQTLASSS